MPIPTGGLAEAAVGFEPLPAGLYDVEIDEVEIRESGDEAKHPGTEYLAVTFNVLDEEYEGRKLWSNVSFHPNAAGILKQFLIAFGYTEEAIDAGADIDEDDLVERRGRVAVKVGTNPKTKEKNNSIRRYIVPSDDDEGSADLPS